MTVDVTVVVGTFGDRSWVDLAERRAIPSASALGAPVVHSHSDCCLDHARNAGLAQVDTEWVIFLDADDELAPGYLDAMGAAWADVRAPAVTYISNPTSKVRRFARVPRVSGHARNHTCRGSCLPDGNWVVIGAMARTDHVRRVGGFKDWPVYEDWCLWLRMFLAGSTFEPVPAAVYRAYARPDSRNRAGDAEARVATHWAIHAAIYGEAS